MRILLIILLVCSTLGLTGAGFLLLKNRNVAPKVKEAPKAFVIVPQSNLVRGHVVGPGDLAWIEWPSSSAAKFVTSKKKEESIIAKFNGRVVISEITANNPIAEKNFISKDLAGGLISALLEPGKRAYTLSVNVDTGGGGFIFPGDYVDVILIQNLRDKLPRSNAPSSSIKLTNQILNSAAETIIQNVKVLAVGTKTYVARNSAEKAVTPVATITLEVNQHESEKLALAKSMGSLSVVLRSLVRGKDASSEGYIADTTASEALNRVIQEFEKKPVSKSSSSPSSARLPKSTSIKIYSGGTVKEKNITSQ